MDFSHFKNIEIMLMLMLRYIYLELEQFSIKEYIRIPNGEIYYRKDTNVYDFCYLLFPLYLIYRLLFLKIIKIKLRIVLQ